MEAIFVRFATCEICMIYLSYVGTSVCWELKMLKEFVLCSVGDLDQRFYHWSDDNIFDHVCFRTASIINTSGVLWKLHLLHITSLKCRSQLKETSFNKSGTALWLFPFQDLFVDKSGFWVFMLTPAHSIPTHTAAFSGGKILNYDLCIFISTVCNADWLPVALKIYDWIHTHWKTLRSVKYSHSALPV